MTVSEQCLKNVVEKLEVDSKLKCQQFGNQIENFSGVAQSPDSKPKTETKSKSTPALKEGIYFSSKEVLMFKFSDPHP